MPDYEKMSDREIDRAVAERVMGIERIVCVPFVPAECSVDDTFTDEAARQWYRIYGGSAAVKNIPRYSTDANAARMVGERMRELGLHDRWAQFLRVDIETDGLLTDESPYGFERDYQIDHAELYAIVMATPRQMCISALEVIDQQEASE